MRSPTSTPIVSCCCLKISFLFFATVIIFFTAGLLLCFEHVDHWELIASRWRPAFSSHLVNALTGKVELLKTTSPVIRLTRSRSVAAQLEKPFPEPSLAATPRGEQSPDAHRNIP